MHHAGSVAARPARGGRRGCASGRFTVHALVGAITIIAAMLIAPPAAHAKGSYSNAAIAEKARTYVGKNGAVACAEAGKKEPYPGECRGFVNCIVWMVSGKKHDLGGAGGSDYFAAFAQLNADEITTVGDLRKGDIVQEGHGSHTFIIVSRISGNRFDVVDSNRNKDEKVVQAGRDVTLGGSHRAFRLGTVSDSESSTPTSVMNKDWRLWSSSTSPDPQGDLVRKGTKVLMRCWSTGENRDGTAKWFKIAVEDSPDVEGFVPANTVTEQWRKSPRC